jgi:hypothetical protein
MHWAGRVARQNRAVIEDDDPGWPMGLGMLWILVPNYGVKRVGRGQPAITALRLAWTGFALSLLGFGIVMAFLFAGAHHQRSQDPWLYLVLMAAAVLVRWMVEPRMERPLDGSSESALVGTYSTRFFLRVAFSEIPALLGFVAAFATGELWVYGLGVLLAAPGLLQAAPTRANLRRDQNRLSEAGVRLSLIRVLATAPRPPAPDRKVS